MRFRLAASFIFATARCVLAQEIHFARVQGDGGEVSVAVSRDSARFLVYTHSDPMVVRTDSATMAAWADSAAAHPTPHRLQAVTLMRVSPDSLSDYRITGDDGHHAVTIVMRADSMRRVFAAMHGDAPVVSLAQPVFTAFQVEREAGLRPGSRGPEYPPELRAAHVNGEVLATFVVDSTGRADVHSFQVVRSTLPQFALAVKQALPAMRFYPAEINGRRVSEVVRMPFTFNADR